MEIKINEEILTKAAQGAVEKGIQDGIGNWEVSRAITQICSEEIQRIDLASMVKDEIKKQLEPALKTNLPEIIKASLPGMMAGIRACINQIGIKMVYGMLSDKPTYGDDKNVWASAEEHFKKENKNA